VRDRVDFLFGSITDVAWCVGRAGVTSCCTRPHALLWCSRRGPAQHGTTSNVNGTLNLLLAARDARVRRVVLAASTAAYGDTPIYPNREDTAPQPLSALCASKLAGEAYAGFQRQLRPVTVLLRYYNVFGPRQDPGSAYAGRRPIFFSKA